jgi:hypothetical protein
MIGPVQSVCLVGGAAAVLLAVNAGCGASSPPVAADGGLLARSNHERNAVQRLKSRPDLRPPRVDVRRRSRRAAHGYVFVAPLNGRGQDGPMILDRRGRVVWFKPLRDKFAMTFRVQRYRGRRVLTWWEGRFVHGWGRGEYVIADETYRAIATVRAGNGYQGDHHDFTITPDGTALFTVYVPVRKNLSSVGGHRGSTVMDGVLQEVDIATGRVLFEWHSLRHVGIAESYKTLPRRSRDPWDYFHINSIDVDADGNLLVSARNTHALYKIDRRTGAIIWRLGGKRSDFAIGSRARFAWQHDARRQRDGTISLFDNEALPRVGRQSRGLVLAVDVRRKRATLKREYRHPRRLLAASKGSMQVLKFGHAFVGWGSEPFLSEFGRGGHLLFDARFSGPVVSYGAYSFRWTGRPSGRPDVAVTEQGNGRHTVYASWNGATTINTWRVLAGAGPDALRPVRSVRRDGFETAIRLRTAAPYVAVQARDGSGRVIGTSHAVRP